MLSAIDVARYLIRIGWSPESPEDSVLLTPLRLQKLLYFCQGYYLALFDEPLFREPIEAWANGPVVRDVWERFQGNAHGITPEVAGEADERVTETQRAFLEMIWQEFSQLPPAKLIEMTRQEPAWKEARSGRSAEEPSTVPLSRETMKVFFAQQVGEKARKAVPAGFPVPDPKEVWQAELQFEQSGGKGISMDDAFRRAKAACRLPTPTG